MRNIPIYQPQFGAAEIRAASAVIASGQLTMGRQVREFEERFAAYVGAPHAVAVDTCTSAIFLSIQLLAEVEEIGVPSVTFVSVASSVLHAGRRLRFEDRLTVGHAYPLSGTPIWDCAHELSRGDYRAGQLRCYSFYPTKVLGSAEGGMIATDRADWADWLRKARAHGMVREGYDWDYAVEFLGWKLNMTNVQAAIGLVQLERLDALNAERQALLDRYNARLGSDNRSLHVYPILVEDRPAFIDQLKAAGIGCSVHFKPIHSQPAYLQQAVQARVTQDGPLPRSEHWGRHAVSLPLWAGMSLDDIDYICDHVEAARAAGSGRQPACAS